MKTIASPLCCFDGERCPRQGRAILGRPRRRPHTIQRAIRCLTCGAWGEDSEARPAPARKAARA